VLHRQVGGVLPLEDAIDIAGRLPELVDEISPIGDQAAGSDARRASRLNGAGNHLLRLTNERYWTSQRSKQASSNSLPSELIWPGAPAIPSRALPLFGLALRRAPNWSSASRVDSAGKCPSPVNHSSTFCLAQSERGPYCSRATRRKAFPMLGPATVWRGFFLAFQKPVAMPTKPRQPQAPKAHPQPSPCQNRNSQSSRISTRPMPRP
jgi:hypothetical protein